MHSAEQRKSWFLNGTKNSDGRRKGQGNHAPSNLLRGLSGINDSGGAALNQGDQTKKKNCKTEREEINPVQTPWKENSLSIPREIDHECELKNEQNPTVGWQRKSRAT